MVRWSFRARKPCDLLSPCPNEIQGLKTFTCLANFLELLAPRQYPRGLGACLLSAWESVWGQPKLDFRQKRDLDPRKTDLEIFEDLQDADPWVDARIPSLFIYLYSNKNLAIPSEWKPTMDAMRSEMEKYVAGHRLHFQYGVHRHVHGKVIYIYIFI